jgi:pimeloyl-ACP methyl ester carboxylesterase
MSRQFVLALIAMASLGSMGVSAETAQPNAASSGSYGNNPDAGNTFIHDDVRLYYEVYGAGEPLLIVHGNGGSIADLSAQIAHFRKSYQVIAMDSRDHGRSGDSPDEITYEKMSDDLAALLDHLETGPANVLGWSDGGIESLLLAIRHPANVKKMVVVSANLNPGEDAFDPEVISVLREEIDAIAVTDTPRERRQLKVASMMLTQPNIDAQELEVITAPTLVLAGDHDIVRAEHTIEIYQHIPNDELVIFPNATHSLLIDDPALFNATVEDFLRGTVVGKPRVNNPVAALEALQGTSE